MSIGIFRKQANAIGAWLTLTLFLDIIQSLDLTDRVVECSMGSRGKGWFYLLLFE
jgi:hypothetical protein